MSPLSLILNIPKQEYVRGWQATEEGWDNNPYITSARSFNLCTILSLRFQALCS